MKNTTPYKICLAVGCALLFVVMGVSATQQGRVRAEANEKITSITEQHEQALQQLRSDLVAALIQQSGVGGASVYVYDFKNEQVLFERNAYTPYNLASLVKILTARVSADLFVGQEVCMDAQALAAIGDQGFSDGECFSVTEALSALLVSSSNDIADALARHGNGDLVETMQQYIREHDLGITLHDPSGYDFQDPARATTGSAHDILAIAMELLFSSPNISESTTQNTYEIRQHMLEHTYPEVETLPGARFVKTGYTNLAGGNMLAIIEPTPGVLVGVVVMKSGFTSRFTDMEKIVSSVDLAYDLIQI
ncbi:hypothetical protein H6776_00855 [Candidatus Nomurabacteria bacterium]|nr:hypothetical protein [Candidatus Nomurabacteria bacterium]